MGQTKVFLRSGQMAELDAKRAEMLNNAARTIQRQVRTFLARRHLIAMRKAVVTIQKYWRGMGVVTRGRGVLATTGRPKTEMDVKSGAFVGFGARNSSVRESLLRRFVMGVLCVQGVWLESGMRGCVKKLRQYVFRRMFGCGSLGRSSWR